MSEYILRILPRTANKANALGRQKSLLVPRSAFCRRFVGYVSFIHENLFEQD
jgi:hypothetical protein